MGTCGRIASTARRRTMRGRGDRGEFGARRLRVWGASAGGRTEPHRAERGRDGDCY